MRTCFRVKGYCACAVLPVTSCNMLVSVGISAGFCIILPWSILVVEESCSLIDLYTGIRDGSIEVPSTRSCPFEFPETYEKQPFSVAVASKQYYSSEAFQDVCIHCGTSQNIATGRTDIYPTCTSCLRKHPTMYKRKRSRLAGPGPGQKQRAASK